MNKLFLIILFSYPVSGLITKPVFAVTDSLGNYFYQKAEIFLTAAEYDSAVFYYEKANVFFYKEESWERYVESLNHLIFGLRENDKLDSSMVLGEYTLNFADSVLGRQNNKYARTLNELGRNYDRSGEYDEALDFADSSFNILKTFPESIELSENYSLRGSVNYEIGEYDSSSFYYLKAIEIRKNLLGENHISLSSDYNGISLVYMNKGDFKKAEEYLHNCLNVILQTIGEDYKDISTVYNNIAMNYFYSGDNDLALEYYQKAIYIDNENLEPDHFNFGLRYNNIAMALRLNKDYQNAIEYEQKAIGIFKLNLGEEHPHYAAVINNLGRIYFDMGDYENAVESYRAALNILRNKYGDDHPTVAQTLNNIAEVYLQTKDFNNGLFYSNQALSIRLKILGNRNQKVAESYRLIGDIYLIENEVDSALYNYQKALIILADNFNSESPRINPDLDKISSQKIILSVLSRKANAFYLRFKKNMSIEDLTSSAETFALCSDVITKLRRSYKTESAKLAIEESAFNIYESSIAVYKTLFDASGKRAYLEKAFEFAEESKAGILLDALYDSDAKIFSGLPDSLLEKEGLIKVDLSYYETQIQKEKEKGVSADSVRLKSFVESFFSLNRKYDALLNYYEQEFPEYFSIKYRDKLFTINEIQANLLNGNESMIEYFTGDSALFIFTITKNNFSVNTVIINDLDDIVSRFRHSLANLDFNTYLSSAYELYSILYKPIENELAGTEKLYIIPDGILNYVPFESLLTAENKSELPDFSKLDYLINRHEISYFFSAATLIETKRKISQTQSGFAGFAPVFSDDDITQTKIASVIDTSAVIFTKRAADVEGKIYSALPETEKEVTAIFNLFKSKNISSKTFIHGDANESIIKSAEMKIYSIIHIASHGFMNEKRPKLSGILFWINPDDVSEDGILYANEIYNLSLNADLVVLSACESGLGKIIRGEGIIGLTRALTFAGTKNIVVSLWQVADESTSELMIEFYKNILDGKSYSSALREAKLKLIKGGIYSYPLEWGPFVLIGSLTQTLSKGEGF